MIVGHIGGGASSVDTGDIGHSLRFRSAGSTRMSRTPAASNQKTFTISFWVRRGTLGVGQRILQTRDNGGSSANAFGVYFTATNTLYVYRYSSALQLTFESSALFRDPTAWYHIVVSIDTTQATASDRAKIYVNGVLQNTPATLPAQNLDMYWNSAVQHNIGCFDSAGAYSWFLDGYIARICSIDGQALDPSSFGYLNTEINEWVSKSQSAVKAVVDAGGTNSFMLDFDDGTSLTTLGYDKSSKGNNWTLNNFSLTAGVNYDRMLDVPGNSFATLNPLDRGNVTIADGNLKITSTTVADWFRATYGVSSGKWYWEYTPVSTTAGSTYSTGIATNSGTVTSDPFAQSTVWMYYSNNGNKYNGSGSAYGASYTNANLIGIALDLDNGAVYFAKDNTWQNSGDPTSGASKTGAAYSLSANTYFPMCGQGGGALTQVSNFNFGQAPLHASATYHSAAGGYFRYAPPTGYKALCQRNMPDPAILNPEKHFDAVTRTGTGASYTQSSIGFDPDFVWIKRRVDAGYGHMLFDRVRGATNLLNTNNTNAESAGATTLTAFGSGGYTLGTDIYVNESLKTYVDWLWKAGGAAVTNNAGTVSAQVSANVNAGFSIATFASPAAGDFSIGHGLSKAPGLVIAKATNGNTFNWAVFHVGVCTNGQFLRLNTTDAKQTPSGNVWGAAIPSATLVNLTATGAVEASKNCVAYCFAEIPGFSKIFSYTGNGSADGPFVHCGFKPKWVLIKRTDAAGSWVMHDTSRSPYNWSGPELSANASTAEVTGSERMDFLSNGFKQRGAAGSDYNTNGATYIGIAFADVPAKYSLAR